MNPAGSVIPEVRVSRDDGLCSICSDPYRIDPGTLIATDVVIRWRRLGFRGTGRQGRLIEPNGCRQKLFTWIFAYGSLMWRPGFTFDTVEPALVHGFHRALCVASHVHRGTPEAPGLAFGLCPGGSCWGLVYSVADAVWPETLEYLRDREQATSVYREVWVTASVRQAENSGRSRVKALTFVADRNHRQYVSRMGDDELITCIRRGLGVSGPCTEYVLETDRFLRNAGVSDVRLSRLCHRLTALSSASGDKAPQN